MPFTLDIRQAASLILPLAALLAIGFLAIGIAPSTRAVTMSIDTVRVPSGDLHYRAPGLFSIEGHDIDAPAVNVRIGHDLEVMTYQVNVADYALCVEAAACQPISHRSANAALPLTGASYLDAIAYAQWLSSVTGQNWRLPSDTEWAHFAAQASDTNQYSSSQSTSQTNAQRWLDEYRLMASRGQKEGATVRSRGGFGYNLHGIADLAGNIWEWTDTCLDRITINAAGNVMSRLENCGVRTLQGQHRAYMSAFIRDPVAGACAAGTPPDHLGFRLVRQRSWWNDLLDWMHI